MCCPFTGPNPSLAAFNLVRRGVFTIFSRKELLRSFVSIVVLAISYFEDSGLSSTVESKVIEGKDDCLKKCF